MSHGTPGSVKPWDKFDQSAVAKKVQEKLGKHSLMLKNRTQHVGDPEPPLGPEYTHKPKINEMSQAMQRKGPVEQTLIQAGKIYEMHKEHIREKTVLKELSGTTATPKINQISKSMERVDIPIGERLNRTYHETQARLERQRQEKEKNQKMPTHQPKINKESRELSRGGHQVTDLLLKWGEEKERRLQAEQRRREEHEALQIRDPTVSARSQKLVNRMKDRPPASHLGQYLIDSASQKRLDHMERMAIEEIETQPGHPSITYQAAMMVREGDVADRLYHQAQVYAEKMQARRAQRDEEESMARNNTVSQTPRLNNRSIYASVRTLPVELELLRGEEVREARRRERMAELEERERQARHPKINQRSKELAERRGESTQDRLLEPKPVPEPPQEDLDCTFHPEINHRSRQIYENRIARGEIDGDRFEKLTQRDPETEVRVEEMRRELDERQMKECTFAPRIHSTGPLSQDLASYHEPENVIDRFEQWQRRKEERIARKQELEDRKALEGCTFKPQIIGDREPERAKPKDTNVDVRQYWGVDDFVHRYRAAREEKERKKKVPHATGTKWTPNPTKPKEFKFNQRRPKNIKALKKPLTPNHLTPGRKKQPPKTTARRSPEGVQNSSRNDDSVHDEYDGLFNNPSPKIAWEANMATADGQTAGQYPWESVQGGPSEEWLRRREEKLAEEEEDRRQGEKPWRDQTFQPSTREELAMNRFYQRADKARQEKEDQTNEPEAGSRWDPRPTIPREFGFDHAQIEVPSTERPVVPGNVRY